MLFNPAEKKKICFGINAEFAILLDMCDLMTSHSYVKILPFLFEYQAFSKDNKINTF